MLFAFGANLMMTCYGIVFSASGFMIPQLEDPIAGFGITKEQGSWLASIMVKLSQCQTGYTYLVTKILSRLCMLLAHR